MSKRKVYLFLILANLFWAGNYIFGKLVVTELSPLQITFSRWTIAVCLLFPIAHLLEKPSWKMVFKKWRILLAMGLLGAMGYNLLLYEALHYTTSLNASLVNAMNPALIALCAALFLRESITPPRIIGLLISFIGVLVVLTNGHLWLVFQNKYNLGDLIMLGAISIWTIYSLLGRSIKSIPPIASTAVSAFLGLLVLLPFFLMSDMKFPLSQSATIGILYIGIFPSVGSFIFWNSAIREIDASRSGIYMNLITVFTAIISVLIGNPINPSQIFGGLLVFTGVYITTLKKCKKQSLSIN